MGRPTSHHQNLHTTDRTARSWLERAHQPCCYVVALHSPKNRARAASLHRDGRPLWWLL